MTPVCVLSLCCVCLPGAVHVGHAVLPLPHVRCDHGLRVRQEESRGRDVRGQQQRAPDGVRLTSQGLQPSAAGGEKHLAHQGLSPLHARVPAFYLRLMKPQSEVTLPRNIEQHCVSLRRGFAFTR
jgi:hypothetical protein